MKVENKDQDLGLSIRTSLKFFEKFHLGLVVVNIYDEVIFKYSPEIKLKINSFPLRHYTFWFITIIVLDLVQMKIVSQRNLITKKLLNMRKKHIIISRNHYQQDLFSKL